jgi:hypothetical protein
MSRGMQPIYTQIVGAGGAGEINFNNIPQTYTDLKILISSRASTSATRVYLGMRLNQSILGYNNRVLSSGGSSVSSGSNYTGNTEIYIGEMNAATSTASTFCNINIDIPNYASYEYKSIFAKSVYESNASEAFQVFCAGSWLGKEAVTSLKVYPGGGANFVQNSEVTLYGIGN